MAKSTVPHSRTLGDFWTLRRINFRWVGVAFSKYFQGEDSFRDGRLVAPQVRNWVLGVFALTASLIMGVIGLLLCYRQLTHDMSDRLNLANRVLEVALNTVETELSYLAQKSEFELANAENNWCGVQFQRTLNEANAESLLVSRFYVLRRSDAVISACGGLGLTNPFWEFDLNQRGLQIVPSRNIRPDIVVGIVGEHSIVVAVVSPVQLLDRLPNDQGSALVSLLSKDGMVLASTKNVTAQSESLILTLPAIDASLALSRWPMVVRGSTGHQKIMQAVQSQFGFWFVSAVLVTGFFSIYLNMRLRKFSSRAWKLQRALKKRRFAPVVQPIISSQSGQCIGMEILMRWKHPNRGLVPPAEFIDYAERSGLIVPISELLMRLAQQQLSDIAVANPHLYFSFNVTPAQLRLPLFSQTLLEIFDGDPIGPSRVLLELTERDLVDERVRDELVRLRSFGFKVAIDDFGTGHSSLAVLQDLPIDKLKIDRAFVNTISADPLAQPVLDAIIDLAHRLKIEMVAEGIETEQQQLYLTCRGVQALQGFRFARPLTPLDFVTWLTERANKVSVKPEAVAKLAVSTCEDPMQGSPRGNYGPVTDSIAQTFTDLQTARSELERHRWNYGKIHRDCMLGHELVSWLVKRYDLSRSDALKLGRRMLARGFLIHVFEEHDLEDAPFFYRLVSSQATQEFHNINNVSTVTNHQLTSWLKGHHGLKPGNRKSVLLIYRNAVRGSEVVETIMKAGQLDRVKACAAGVQLMRAGLLKHAFDEQGFIDSSHQFYYLTSS
jgi:EAL domain-containing protein (putative c-di-GMP-specific phosphodiesterase class I)